ncbi:MAG: hypothetical protein HRU20_10875 [Pseudomonadales bacterium]|nr:hypothetical protein [Pseudomonadales bacterium]
MTSTIELVTYRLKTGKTQSDLAATHEQVNAFLQQQPGFIYRSCSVDDAGLNYDICYWQSLEQAKTAGDAFMQSAPCQALLQLCDEESVTMRHMAASTEAMGDCSAAA